MQFVVFVVYLALPVANWIKYKLCLLMHQIYTGRAPQYLVDSGQWTVSLFW